MLRSEGAGAGVFSFNLLRGGEKRIGFFGNEWRGDGSVSGAGGLPNSKIIVQIFYFVKDDKAGIFRSVPHRICINKPQLNFNNENGSAALIGKEFSVGLLV